MTTAELADLFGLSDQSVRSLARAGVIARAGRLFGVAASTKRYTAHLREIAAGRGQASGGAQAVSERARLAAAQADSWELKNKLARGEVAAQAEIDSTWSEIVLRARSAVLTAPSRLASELPHLSRHDIATIDRVLRGALTTLGTST